MLHDDIGIDTFASDTTTSYTLHIDTIAGRTHPPTITAATDTDAGDRSGDWNPLIARGT